MRMRLQAFWPLQTAGLGAPLLGCERFVLS
jgi:hypothetical protein